MYRSILVPLDGSTFAEHALPVALNLARRSRATLRLGHVLQPLASVYSEAPAFTEGTWDFEGLIKERLRGYLDALALRMAKWSPAEVSTLLLEGEIVPTLLAHATETKPDLVVLTTHGRSPLGRFWLGSAADELVRVLPMPLLMVRPSEHAVPDFDVEPPLKNVLIPLDGSPLAEKMIRPAVALGRLTNAAYTLLRVIKPVPPVAFPTGSPLLDVQAQSVLSRIDKIQGQLCKEALAYLDGVAGPLRAEGLQVTTKVAIDERPGVAILQEAVSPAVDVVALETHGRYGLSRLLLGSVADKVIRGSAVPVLVHRPHYA